jgi:hypothetical protein
MYKIIERLIAQQCHYTKIRKLKVNGFKSKCLNFLLLEAKIEHNNVKQILKLKKKNLTL